VGAIVHEPRRHILESAQTHVVGRQGCALIGAARAILDVRPAMGVARRRRAWAGPQLFPDSSTLRCLTANDARGRIRHTRGDRLRTDAGRRSTLHSRSDSAVRAEGTCCRGRMQRRARQHRRRRHGRADESRRLDRLPRSTGALQALQARRRRRSGGFGVRMTSLARRRASTCPCAAPWETTRV
jgi:hypothetical protein